MARAPRSTLAGAAAIALAAAAPAAHAQLGVGLAVDSDVRVRGISLTGRDPAVSATLSYDHPSGAHASATGIWDGHGGVRHAGHAVVLGYAARGQGDLTWDVGVADRNYRLYGASVFRAHYSEVYVGLARGPIAVRASYSPNYINPHSTGLYLEAETVMRPANGWRVTSHFGVFDRLSGAAAGASTRRYDARFGVARDIPRGEVRLSWATAWPQPLPHDGRSRSGVAVGAAVFF